MYGHPVADGPLVCRYGIPQLRPMPRRELLSSFEREHLLAFPRDDAALLRVATLSSEDLAFIGQHAFLVFDLVGGNACSKRERDARCFVHPKLNDGEEAIGLFVGEES